MEDKKIEIRICVGTLCAVMGGSDLQLIDEYLPQEWLPHLNIVGSTCIGPCKDTSKGLKPPFVAINGEVIPEASITAIHRKVEQILKDEHLIDA